MWIAADLAKPVELVTAVGSDRRLADCTRFEEGWKAQKNVSTAASGTRANLEASLVLEFSSTTALTPHTCQISCTARLMPYSSKKRTG